MVEVFGEVARDECSAECGQPGFASEGSCATRLEANGAASCSSLCPTAGASSGTPPGDDAGADTAPPVTRGVECATASDDTCECTAGSTTPNDVKCRARFYPTHSCCSSKSWPASGSCSCTLGIRCEPLNGDRNTCFCAKSTTYTSYEPGYQDTDACSSLAGNTCCWKKSTNTCACWQGQVCDADEEATDLCQWMVAGCPSTLTEQDSCQ